MMLINKGAHITKEHTPPPPQKKHLIGPFPSSLVLLFQKEFKSKVQNHSYENDLQENEPVSETHFHINGFALRLVLIKRQKTTRKWPIPACPSVK